MSHIDSGQGNGKSIDVELNIAPIIDAFVVLIAFLLASASFIAIGILDAGIEGPAASASEQKPDPINITVEVNSKGQLRLLVTGKTKMRKTYKSLEDTKEITRTLASLQKKWPKVKTVTLKATNQVPYLKVIKTMETIRKTYPNVVLGGF